MFNTMQLLLTVSCILFLFWIIALEGETWAIRKDDTRKLASRKFLFLLTFTLLSDITIIYNHLQILHFTFTSNFGC